MTNAFDGHYPIENRDGEIERLHLQGQAMAPDTETMLDRIGVGEGWSCLDIGCGPRGITNLLSHRVGPKGRVVGLDMNEDFLQQARRTAAANTEFVHGDAFGSKLDRESFDFVHLRFVASTAGEPERLIDEAIRLTRPGGSVACQEPDASTLQCFPPDESWDQLRNILLAVFRGVGADLELARRLYWIMNQSTLCDIQFRPFVIGVRTCDAMVDYLPSTIESLRANIRKLKIASETELDDLLSKCRNHLAQPGTCFTMYTVAQVWGRRPK